jgi:chromosomal replication initiator protein
MKLTLDEILEKVSSFYGFKVEECTTRSRKVEFVKVRQQYCKIAKDETTLSYDSIGKKIFRDHVTVMHACNQVNNLIQTDKFYKAEFLELRDKILGTPVIFEPIDINEIIKQTNEI